MMNQTMFIGRLVRTPEVIVTAGGNGNESMKIAKFTLAVDRRSRSAKGDQEADFIPCVAFGKTAEFAEKYLAQGTKIAARGRMQSGSYKNKEGQNVHTLENVVEEIEFAESKASGAGQTAEASTNNYMHLPDSQ